MQQLRINEIFYSIQGESVRAGLPTTFIRLSGCPLRCTYCDTEYAFKGGMRYSEDDIIEKVKSYPTPYLTITGGEPLAQIGCKSLVKRLLDLNYQVSIETSGAFDISGIDQRAMFIMDLKTPASGEESKNRFDNLAHLKKTDQVKFVICNREDYLWAKSLVLEHKLHQQAQVLFSPEWQHQSLRELANWILEDGLQVRFQAQLHKVIWPDCHGPGI